MLRSNATHSLETPTGTTAPDLTDGFRLLPHYGCCPAVVVLLTRTWIAVGRKTQPVLGWVVDNVANHCG